MAVLKRSKGAFAVMKVGDTVEVGDEANVLCLNRKAHNCFKKIPQEIRKARQKHNCESELKRYMEKLANIILVAKKKKRISSTRLSALSGIPVETIKGILKAQISPSYKTRTKIAKALGLAASALEIES